ncbi:MAG: hypothetical protein Q8Q94_02025 [bacterium]|nr:hypothetical protein [bacterium]MDZ4299709.1 hypothetical protein [Candidatus Sungbacteria bacterium]
MLKQITIALLPHDKKSLERISAERHLVSDIIIERLIALIRLGLAGQLVHWPSRAKMEEVIARTRTHIQLIRIPAILESGVYEELTETLKNNERELLSAHLFHQALLLFLVAYPPPEKQKAIPSG